MKKKILIIDDEPDYLNIAAKMLLQEGYEVMTAASGAEGLKKIKHFLPDLILLDIGLPDASGIEITGKLKAEKKTASIPILLFTVRSELNYVKRGINAGARDYIIKPFDIDEFVKRINKFF
ncbi:MAG: response regulator transcription factor [Elusimicrobia bacterium]|nr:response regulator transcription factor [Elusimicrobiota bacterium]